MTIEKDEIENIITWYPAFVDAMCFLDKALKTAGNARPLCGFIKALSGTGKTTLIKEFVKKYPIVESSDQMTIPVLKADAPENGSPKSLLENLIIAIDEGNSCTGNVSALCRSFIALSKSSSVQLILIDEANDFMNSHSKKDFNTTRKVLKKICDAGFPVILVGTEEIHNLISHMPSKEFSRRFRLSNTYEMLPFKLDTEAHRDEFKDLLEELDSLINLVQPSLFSEENVTKIYIATNGLMDDVMSLIRRAAKHAVEEKSPSIKANHLEQAFETEITSSYVNIPDNPFSCSLRQIESWRITHQLYPYNSK